MPNTHFTNTTKLERKLEKYITSMYISSNDSITDE
jgi:hypothetical protein